MVMTYNSDRDASEGAAAYDAGKPIDANPFKLVAPGYCRTVAWREGYEARRAQREAVTADLAAVSPVDAASAILGHRMKFLAMLQGL